MREERRLRVFDNRVLRKIFGPKTIEVEGEWRKLHNEELPDLYCSPHITRVITRRIRYAGMWLVCERGEMHREFWWGNLKPRGYLEDLGVDGRIILKCMLKE
jgi:diadenosine tetraphosphatase ApaH/serine/threonine PP2A family protein phosphatase